MDEPEDSDASTFLVPTSILNLAQTLVRKVAEWEKAPLDQWGRLGSVYWWRGKERSWYYAPPGDDVRERPLPTLSIGLQLKVTGQEWEEIAPFRGEEDAPKERGKQSKLALRVALFPRAADLTEVRLQSCNSEGLAYRERFAGELARCYPDVQDQLAGEGKRGGQQGMGALMVVRTKGRPDWLPTKRETRDRWQEAFGYMCDLDETYEGRWDLYGEDPEPKLADYGDYLVHRMKWKLSEKTIARIKRAGKERWL